MDDEGGNADFLMFADLDYSHPEVCEDVTNWGKWIVNEVGLRGFRLDAVQHFSNASPKNGSKHYARNTATFSMSASSGVETTKI